jgi:hypothetical protein
VGGHRLVVAAQDLADLAVGRAGVGFDCPPDLPALPVGRGERSRQLGRCVLERLPAHHTQIVKA